MNTSSSISCFLWKRIGLALGLLVASVFMVHAEEPAAPKLPVMFTVMAWDVFDSTEDLVLNYRSKGKPQAVDIVWRDRSPAFACDGPGQLVFSRTAQRGGKKVEVPVATADIPAGMTRALLVFGRNSATEPGAMPYKVTVIDDSYTIFPGQSVRFINYSVMEMAGSLGDQVFTVHPGREHVVSAALSPDVQLLSLRLARRDAAGGWRRLRSTMLPMSEGLRVLMFLIDDPAKPGRPELVLIRDRVEPAETS